VSGDRNNRVGLETAYRDGRFVVRYPVEIFSSHLQIGPGSHPASRTVGTRALSRR
jgi:hypothetical protein